MPVSLCDYSAEGFAVDMPRSRFPAGAARLGQLGRLELSPADNPLRFDCRMQDIVACGGRLRFGLERQDFTESPVDEHMLPIPEPLQIRAESPNPLLYGRRTGLRLIGIGRGQKLVFACMDGTLLACLGGEMPISLSLPARGGGGFRGRIRRIDCIESSACHANRPGKTCAILRVELEPVGICVALAETLREHLVSGCGIPSDLLTARGFPLRPRARQSTMTFVDNMDQYREVLKLRYAAYAGAGKCPEDSPVESMSSKWDNRSRILCLFLGKTLAATVTLTFPDSSDGKLRSETAFAGSAYPCPMPDRRELIEVSGLCIHRDFRKGDLLQGVFRHVARLLLLSERRYIVSLADAKMARIYRRMGFQVPDVVCTYLGVEHRLILLDKRSIITGRGASRTTWHAIFGGMFRELERQGSLPLGGMDRVRIKMRLALRSVAGQIVRRLRAAPFWRAPEAGRGGCMEFVGGRMETWH